MRIFNKYVQVHFRSYGDKILKSGRSKNGQFSISFWEKYDRNDNLLVNSWISTSSPCIWFLRFSWKKASDDNLKSEFSLSMIMKHKNYIFVNGLFDIYRQESNSTLSIIKNIDKLIPGIVGSPCTWPCFTSILSYSKTGINFRSLIGVESIEMHTVFVWRCGTNVLYLTSTYI